MHVGDREAPASRRHPRWDFFGYIEYGCIYYIKLHLKGVLQCIIVADIQLEPILEKNIKKWRQNGSKCTLRTLPPDSKCTLRTPKQVNT